LILPERISRFLTFLLRHRPKEYPLAFDAQGFVAWPDLVQLVQDRFQDITEDEIRAVVTDSEKKRFELRENRVRATYGHSFPVALGSEAMEPPSQLFYGTARDLAQSILRSGLRPRDRQYVHLSASLEEAQDVGRRHDPAPAIIVVDAKRAHTEGVQFFASGPLFLTENIPARFLSLWQKSEC